MIVVQSISSVKQLSFVQEYSPYSKSRSPYTYSAKDERRRVGASDVETT